MTEDNLRDIERDLEFAKASKKDFFYIEKSKVVWMVTRIRELNKLPINDKTMKLKVDLQWIDSRLNEIREFIKGIK